MSVVLNIFIFHTKYSFISFNSDEDNTATFSAGGSSNVFNPSEDTEDDVDLEVQRLLNVYDVVKDEKDQNW